MHVSVDTEKGRECQCIRGCLQAAHARGTVAQGDRSRQRTCVWRSAEEDTIRKGIDTSLPTPWLRTQCPLLQPQPGWLASRLLCILPTDLHTRTRELVCICKSVILPIYLFKHLLFLPPIFSANIDRFALIIYTSPFPPHCI